MPIDIFGMPIEGGDCGDSCRNYFTGKLRLFIIGISVLKKMEKEEVERALPAMTFMNDMADVSTGMEELEVSPGIWIRNPDLTKWYSDPRNLSRDQLAAVICFLAYVASNSRIYGSIHRKALWRLFFACLKRGMFAQNIYPNWVDPRTQPVNKKTPDFITPDLWAVMVRGLLGPLSYIPNFLLDACILASVAIKLWAPLSADGTLKFRMPGPDDVDDDNMHNVLMTSKYAYPTPLSLLALKMFKKFRKKNLGNTVLGETDAMMGALKWRHDPVHAQGIDEMAEIARPIIARY